LRPEIDKNEADTQAMVVDLEIRQKAAAAVEKSTAVEEAEALKVKKNVLAIKSECDEALAKAMPIYREALKALDTLDKNDINEMKAYGSPAEDVVLVVRACALLLGFKENHKE
jgi:dynein heavy chain